MNAIVLPVEGDQEMVQAALPGFMFALAFASLREKGFEVRLDLEELANKSSAAALMKATGARQQRLCGIVQRHGYEILKNAGTEKLTLLIGGLSRCLVKMQDQGRNVDHDAVLVALGICAEIDDGVTDWGSVNQINTVMAKLDNEFVRLGYFPDPGVKLIARSRRFFTLQDGAPV